MLWQDKPYFPISQYYQKRFGEKIYKLPVTIVDSCPNREGLKGMQTCVFCDEWGSAARSQMQNKPLTMQIEECRQIIRKNYKANKFLVYFQAYTNSFAKINYIENCFEEALAQNDVVGLVVGTRPDCISPALLRLWQKYSERTYLAIELGVQSFVDDHLHFLRRGHKNDQTIRAFETLSAIPTIDLGIHLIFGIPHETDDHIRAAARMVNSYRISNVKLHNLHVLKNTPLEQMYLKGEFVPISIEEYSQRVSEFLRVLSPEVSVHRLGAVASRWDELVAPEWTKHKLKTVQHIISYLKANHIHQGQEFLAL